MSTWGAVNSRSRYAMDMIRGRATKNACIRDPPRGRTPKMCYRSEKKPFATPCLEVGNYRKTALPDKSIEARMSATAIILPDVD